MAVNNAKFDSFLKRVLPNSEYKEVKVYEPCVVISSSEKHTYRFSFLTNERIYITENPPKTLLFHVDVKDVISVDIVHDIAVFLQADLRKNTQHVVIKYATQGLKGKLSKPDLDIAEVTPGREPVKSLESDYNAANPSMSQSSAWQPGTPSSSNRVPILGSYTDMRRSESNRSKVEAKATDSSVKLKYTAKSNQYGKVMTRSWENRDPFSVHVMQTDQRAIVDELHLYILNGSTTFLLMLKAIWRNFIIYRSSEVEDCKKAHTVTPSVGKGNPQAEISFDESTRALFSELTQELLRAQAVEDLYGLYHELQKASSRDILIKFLFWSDDILFKKTVQLLAKYIESFTATDTNERADEIELINIMLQTLAVMLREVEAIPKCYRVLLNMNHSSLAGLVNSLLMQPTLSVKFWATDCNIEPLLIENTVAASEVLYPLIQAAEQVHWIIGGKSNAFNQDSLSKIVDGNKNLHKFLDRLMHACTTTWSKASKSNSQFTPEQALNVYRLFSLLHRAILRSPLAAHYVKSNFQEEFRYYINPASVAARFPLSYHISGMARSVVHAIGAAIAEASAHS